MVEITRGWYMTESIDKPEPILLKKFLMIGAALYDKNLSKGDVSVQWQILDRYSVANGDCWPSLKRLAADTGLTQRTIQRSVTKLIESGHSIIVKHGNRVSSNHYKPDFSLLDRVETATSLPSNEVETATSVCRDSQVPKVETPTSLKPINEPEHQARGELVGLSANATSAASLASPLGGLPLASKDKYKYPEFWNAYPTRKNVGKTEDEITAKLSDGVLLADIVEGARLYAINVQSKRMNWKGDKDYTIHPQNFVKYRGWLDDHTIVPKTEAKPKVVKVKVEPIAAKTVKAKATKVKPKAKVIKTDEEKAIAKVKRERAKIDRAIAVTERTRIFNEDQAKIRARVKERAERQEAEKIEAERIKIISLEKAAIEARKREVARRESERLHEEARKRADPKPWDDYI